MAGLRAAYRTAGPCRFHRAIRIAAEATPGQSTSETQENSRFKPLESIVHPSWGAISISVGAVRAAGCACFWGGF